MRACICICVCVSVCVYACVCVRVCTCELESYISRLLGQFPKMGQILGTVDQRQNPEWRTDDVITTQHMKPPISPSKSF